MSDNVLYSDRLLEIDDYSILLHDYYFPSSRSRRIRFAEIESVTVVQPTIFTGRYRRWGWRGRRWFAQDSDRPERDRIFWMELTDGEGLNPFLPSSCCSIGFTAENSGAVCEVLRDKCPLSDILYGDRLLQVNEDCIFLWGYYLGIFPKRVKFGEIERVSVADGVSATTPTYGTHDFRSWFPPDLHRTSRDRIFKMKLLNQWWQPSFSTEDSEALLKVLKDNVLITVSAP